MLTATLPPKSNSASESFQIEVKEAPTLIQADLYLSRNTEAGAVTEQQFGQFLSEVVTPRFPNGLTVYDTQKQSLTNKQLTDAPSKVISLVFEDTPESDRSIEEILKAYQQKFAQADVLRVANKDLAVGFDQSEDLIQNNPTPELIQVDLYFGRNVGNSGQVTEEQFRQFLGDEITPRFPNGLTTYQANGQFLDSSGQLIREPSNVVSLIFEDTQANEQSIDEIINAYKQQFQQESVLEVVNETVKVGFGQGDDLIDNNVIPEPIQVDLYFGRNIGTTGQVTEAQFQQFLSREVTPRFWDGLTVYDANGQFLDSANQLIREPSKVISLVIEDTQKNERAIDEIIATYKQQFQQESVLQVVDETLNVGKSAHPLLPGCCPLWDTTAVNGLTPSIAWTSS
jgi:predicted metal-binding protein